MIGLGLGLGLSSFLPTLKELQLERLCPNGSPNGAYSSSSLASAIPAWVNDSEEGVVSPRGGG